SALKDQLENLGRSARRHPHLDEDILGNALLWDRRAVVLLKELADDSGPQQRLALRDEIVVLGSRSYDPHSERRNGDALHAVTTLSQPVCNGRPGQHLEAARGGRDTKGLRDL